MTEKEKKTEKRLSSFDIFKSVKDFAGIVSFFIDKEIRKHGITPSQYLILKTIKEKKPSNQKKLGEYLVHTGGNITVVSKLLEKRKLIKKTKLDYDNRFSVISLTRIGEEKIQETEECCNEILDSIMANLNDEEAEAIYNISNKMVDIFYDARLKEIKNYKPPLVKSKKKKKKK